MQLAGWIPTTRSVGWQTWFRIGWGFGFAVYPTIETLAAQLVAGPRIGSYYAARERTTVVRIAPLRRAEAFRSSRRSQFFGAPRYTKRKNIRLQGYRTEPELRSRRKKLHVRNYYGEHLKQGYRE
jgi:hypothetical protein